MYPKWYEEAATAFILALSGDPDYPAVEILKEIRKSQENDIRFHFNNGMVIRNTLRECGFTDDTYGNLDDHYFPILNIAYRKCGIDEYFLEVEE